MSYLTCSTCKKHKDTSSFGINLAKRNGFRSQCNECISAQHKQYYSLNKKKCYDRTNAWRKKNPSRIKASKIKSKYGLSADAYASMCLSQDNKCLLCLRDVKLVVDHDHVTGRVRGLLCRKCNSGLGLFLDNSDALLRASTYVGE